MKKLLPQLKFRFSTKKSFWDNLSTEPKKYKFGMPSEEALRILNIEKKGISVDLVKQRAVTMYNQNDPELGGSPYIQAKVINAYNSLMQRMGQSIDGTNEFDQVLDKFVDDALYGDNSKNNQFCNIQ